MAKHHALRKGLYSRLGAFLLLFVPLAGCVQLAGYDQQAYENATSLKAATLAMMDKSGKTGSYSQQEAAIEQLRVQLRAAYEYANGVDNNNEAARNWRELIGDPALLGAEAEPLLISSWIQAWNDRDRDRSEGAIARYSVLLPELKIQIAEGFDTIICLEANKRELTACNALTSTE